MSWGGRLGYEKGMRRTRDEYEMGMRRRLVEEGGRG